MEKDGEEKKIGRLLTDPLLSERIRLILKDPEFSEKIKRFSADLKLLENITAMLEKDHAIDCIMLLHMSRGEWKKASEFMHKNGLALIDGTFRARMIEIRRLGLANKDYGWMDRSIYTETDLGQKIARLLLEFLTR